MACLRPGQEVGMSDVAQPHAQPAVAEQPSPNGSEPQIAEFTTPAAFPELVLAHHEWRKAVARNRPSAELERDYCRKLERFEQVHGRIINAYWCLNVPSAVALTAKPRARLLRKIGFRPTLTFHRVTDWATTEKPGIAAKLHRCDQIAIRASEVLSGVRERIAMQMVMASASHLLSLADDQAGHRDHRKVLEQERRHLVECSEYYRNAANGQTQMIYFAGMGVFAVLIGLFALINNVLPGADNEFFGALFAGAIGAVVSVVARINSGRFDLEYDVGRAYPFFLGGLRPLLGAAFGLGVYFAVSSGLLTIVPIPDKGTDRLYAIIVVCFVAGFSERWAKDTLAVAAGERPADDARARRHTDVPQDSKLDAEEDEPARKPVLEPGH
jgi:hypothetical protein